MSQVNSLLKMLIDACILQVSPTSPQHPAPLPPNLEYILILLQRFGKDLCLDSESGNSNHYCSCPPPLLQAFRHQVWRLFAGHLSERLGPEGPQQSVPPQLLHVHDVQ